MSQRWAKLSSQDLSIVDGTDRTAMRMLAKLCVPSIVVVAGVIIAWWWFPDDHSHDVPLPFLDDDVFTNVYVPVPLSVIAISLSLTGSMSTM